MRDYLFRGLFLFLFTVTSFTCVQAEYINGDPRADAPALAYRGDYAVGVKTIELVNKHELDILNYTPQTPYPLYDRPLTVEVWYPAELRQGQVQVNHL